MSPLVMLLYLLAAVLFIVGLKKLGSPATAPGGNRLAAVGMLIAILATLIFGDILSYTGILIAMVVGSTIGWVLAKKVQMTGMPQMVALLNGFGGGASALVASAEFLRFQSSATDIPITVAISIQLGVLVGAVTFSGSLIAFAKLQELVTGRAVTYPLQKTVNALLLLVTLGFMTALIMSASTWQFGVLVALALLLGVLSVIAIGGADMPVVISLLNSYSGIAAALTGFVIGNHGLIIAGALVGASGIILTKIMCKAMNRSLANVLFGAFGATAIEGGPAGAIVGDQTVKQVSVEDVATMLAYARSVIVVPGYGLAVAQAQHEVRWPPSSRHGAGRSSTGFTPSPVGCRGT